MSEMIHFFMEICYAIFGGFCLQYFLGSFLEYRNFLEHREFEEGKKFSGLKPRETALFAAASYAACTLLLSRFLPYGYADIRVLARQAALLGVTALLAVIFYRAFGGHSLYPPSARVDVAVSSVAFFCRAVKGKHDAARRRTCDGPPPFAKRCQLFSAKLPV